MFLDFQWVLFKKLFSLYADSFKRLPFITVMASIIVTSIILSIVVLIVYSVRMGGNISGSSSDWGDFGSLLSGVFTFAGTSAAITTLLLLVKQHGDQTRLYAKQLESFEFDMFDKHRKVFFEKIAAFESKYTECHVEDKERLYDQLFPYNSPLNCDLKIDLDSDSQRIGSLSNIVHKMYHLLREFSEKDVAESEFWKIATALSFALHMRSNDSLKEGDVLVGNRSINFNIYRLVDCLVRFRELINSLLIFSGNRKLDQEFPDFLHPEKLHELISYSYSENGMHGVYNVVKKDVRVANFESVYLKIFEKERELGKELMPSSKECMYFILCIEEERSNIGFYKTQESLNLFYNFNRELEQAKNHLSELDYNHFFRFKESLEYLPWKS